MRQKNAGFTLVELLVVVAILGIITAIAIPSLRQAIDKAKQRRTMADMRTVALAVNAYAVDFSFAPKFTKATVAELRPFLTPTYLRTLPEVDGWHRAMFYEAEALSYTLLSMGADGVEQTTVHEGPTTEFAADIIMTNGVFVQWPEGMQAR